MPEAFNGVRPDLRGTWKLCRHASFTTAEVSSQFALVAYIQRVAESQTYFIPMGRGNPLFFAASAVETNAQVKLQYAQIALHLPDACPRSSESVSWLHSESHNLRY